MDNILNHCVVLLTNEKYDTTLANDDKVKEIRNELGDVEIQLSIVMAKLEALVNGTTEYKE